MSVRKRKWRRKDGTYSEKWMVHIAHTLPDGTQRELRRVSPVQTKRGAQSFERELRRQLLEEHTLHHRREIPQPQAPANQQPTPTLAEFAEEFLAYQATINKPSELRSKRSVLTIHLIPAFGTRRLDQIDARSVDRYKVRKLSSKRGRRRDSKGLKPKTVNNHLAVLGRMLRVAKKWGLITAVPEIEMLRVRKQPFDFLDFEEADLLIATAKEQLPEWHPFVVVALRTGLRVGELLALRWREDVDLNRKRLRCNGATPGKAASIHPRRSPRRATCR